MAERIYWQICLFVIACILYINTFSAGYVWDDRAAVVGNADVVGNNNIVDMFAHDFWGQDITSATSHKSYRPMTTLSFRFNHILHGIHPAGYHIGNVIIYGVCVVLFYSLSTRWISDEGSIVASLFFCLHPVHVEGVASLVGRADTLCSLFLVLSLLLYSDGLAFSHAKSKTIMWKGYAFIVASYVCALCAALSKEIGLTSFAVFVALEAIYISAQLQEQQFPRKSSSTNYIDGHPVTVMTCASWLLDADDRTRYILSKQRRRSVSSVRASRQFPHTQAIREQALVLAQETIGYVTSTAKYTMRVWFPSWSLLPTSKSLSEARLHVLSPRPASAGEGDDEVSSVGSQRSGASSSGHTQQQRAALVTSATLMAAAMRIGCGLLLLVLLLITRFILHGDQQLYKWTVMENNISLLPVFSHRLLSYAQTHYFYFLKLFNPLTPHLCFDYGFACLPEIRSIWVPANILPLAAYCLLLYTLVRAVVQCRRTIVLALVVMLVTLLPALNILFPVGTLLAERLMFAPSLGAALLVGELLTVDMREIWEALANAGYGRDLRTLGLPVEEWRRMLISGRGVGANTSHSAGLSMHSLDISQSSTQQSSGTTAVGVGLSSSTTYVDSNITVSSRLRTPWVSALCVVLVPILAVMAGRVVLRNFDWRNEASLFRSALDVCPTSVKGLNNNGMLQLGLGHAEEALAMNEKALEIHPMQTSAYINGGLANRHLKQYARSILKFQKALEVSNSASFMAHGYMGNALFDWYNALTGSAPPEYLQDSIENATAEVVWADVLRLLLREAAGKLDQALTSGWTPPAILYARGSVELEIKMRSMKEGDGHEGSWPVAISLLELAIEKNRELKAMERAGVPVQDAIDEVVAWNQLGLVLWKSGKLAKAEAAFMNGINSNPLRYELLVNLGSLYRDNNLPNGARDMFGRAMAMFEDEDGQGPPAALLNNAGLIELDLGNMAAAADMFGRALQVLEHSGGVHHPHYVAIRGNLDKARRGSL